MTKTDCTVTGKRTLAAFFDVTSPTIDAWAGSGMPVIRRGGRGRAWLFDLQAVVRWKLNERDEGRLDPQVERARLDRARRLAQEMLNRQRAGELIEVEEVGKTWVDLVTTSKNKLLALPTALALDIADLETAGEVEQTLRDAIHECLRELSKPDAYK